MPTRKNNSGVPESRSRTRYKAELDTEHFDAEAEVHLVDVLAGTAFLLGLTGFTTIPLIGQIGGGILLAGSGTYFGMKYLTDD